MFLRNWLGVINLVHGQKSRSHCPVCFCYLPALFFGNSGSGNTSNNTHFKHISTYRRSSTYIGPRLILVPEFFSKFEICEIRVPSCKYHLYEIFIRVHIISFDKNILLVFKVKCSSTNYKYWNNLWNQWIISTKSNGSMFGNN